MAAVADDWPPAEISAAEAKIEVALAEATKLEFIESPLMDVIDYLQELHGISIQIDQRVLRDRGIDSSTPVTRRIKGVSLRSALTSILRELDLTFVVRDDVLLITTPDEADYGAYVEVYNIAPLLDDKHDAKQLVEILKHTIDADREPPRCRISSFRDLLVLKAERRDHREVRRLLGVMGTALGIETPKSKVAAEPPPPVKTVLK
jgi:hypothetical protein